MTKESLEPRLEAQARQNEAGSGWLIWLSLCSVFIFSLVLISGEIDGEVGLAGLILSSALFLYERRRVRSVREWSFALGSGCAGGIVLATVVGHAVDKIGLMKVWDVGGMTLNGMLLVWGVMILGMGLIARWFSSEARRERLASVAQETSDPDS
jgi:hypothetical protein